MWTRQDTRRLLCQFLWKPLIYQLVKFDLKDPLLDLCCQDPGNPSCCLMFEVKWDRFHLFMNILPKCWYDSSMLELDNSVLPPCKNH